MKRPLKDRRPVGPFVSLEDDSSTTPNSENEQQNDTDDGRPYFETIDDLPESPMLRNYVKQEKQWSGNTEFEVINSRAVEEYMKQLGVWEMAINGN